ncbi:MAG: DinB family protein [Anaerolineae bacterium]|nr:DinB family protein [Anaerolineae bacterium]
MTTDPKTGRPREYRLANPTGFANPEAAKLMAQLDEARARTMDLFDDLTLDESNFVPDGTTLSIGALAIHMAYAESVQMSRVTGATIPPDLNDALEPIGRAVNLGKKPPVCTLTGAEIAALCKRVHDEVSYPGFSALQDVDKAIATTPFLITPRGMATHLAWHWTHHGGQVALLRDMCGAAGYNWTFKTLG